MQLLLLRISFVPIVSRFSPLLDNFEVCKEHITQINQYFKVAYQRIIIQILFWIFFSFAYILTCRTNSSVISFASECYVLRCSY